MRLRARRRGVVVTRPVTVVVREVVVRAGVTTAGVVADVEVVVDAVGCRGAAAFCTCVAANALMDASDVSVAAVAIARSTTPERMSGERFAMSDT